MNLAILGFIMIIVFMVLIMSRKMSALVALIVVPVVFGLIGGFYSSLGKDILDGLTTVAPTVIMLIFAILYFGVMIDTGLFNPIIRIIMKGVKGDPVKITIGTVALASIVALDGDGTTTFIITVAAMMPLYKKMGMNLYNIIYISFIINWCNEYDTLGRTDSTSLQLTTEEVFTAGILFAFFAAYVLGARERKRIGIQNHLSLTLDEMNNANGTDEDDKELLRPTTQLLMLY